MFHSKFIDLGLSEINVNKRKQIEKLLGLKLWNSLKLNIKMESYFSKHFKFPNVVLFIVINIDHIFVLHGAQLHWSMW